MGAFISKPDLKTQGTFDKNEFYEYSSCSMQGWRKNQEDCDLCEANLLDENSASIFAVFDGHGGSSVAKFCAQRFPIVMKDLANFRDKNPIMTKVLKDLYLSCDELITKSEIQKELAELSDEEEEIEIKDKEIDELQKDAIKPLETIVEELGGEEVLSKEGKILLENRRKSSINGQSSSNEVTEKTKNNAIIKAISEEIANQMVDEYIPGYTSGCTACTALIVPDKATKGVRLFVANAGDSRAVLCRNGKAIDLSCDHKPELDMETNRIKAAGGVINEDGRVNGGLNLSRAIGDHKYKNREDLSLSNQMITAEPDVTDTLLDPSQDEFLVIACDGIWNVMTSQEVVDFVSARLKDPELVGKERKRKSDFVQMVEEDESSDESVEIVSDSDDLSEENGKDGNDSEEEKGKDENGGEEEKCKDENDGEEEKGKNENDSEEENGKDENDSEEESGKDENDSEEENGDDEDDDDDDDDEDDEEVEHMDGPGLLQEISKDLFHSCLAPSTAGDGTGCDNMTCIIIKFTALDKLSLNAKVDCGPINMIELPINDESEIINRRKRMLSGSSDGSNTEDGSKEEEEMNTIPAMKKAKHDSDELLADNKEILSSNGNGVH